MTRNRPHWLPGIVQCAKYQTYRNKEILVVSSGQDVTQIMQSEPTCRHLHLPGKPTTGAARNAGCAAANGEVIALFDDDDFSHPRRLEDQVQRLVESGKHVTGYRTMRFHDGRDWWLYNGAQSYALGTSLVFTKAFWTRNKFPDEVVGEDNAFVCRARSSGAIAVAEAGEMMWATIHETNTSPRRLTGKSWQRL